MLVYCCIIQKGFPRAKPCGDRRSQALSILMRPGMTHGHHRSLISAGTATAVATEWRVFLELCLGAEHSSLSKDRSCDAPSPHQKTEVKLTRRDQLRLLLTAKSMSTSMGNRFLRKAHKIILRSIFQRAWARVFQAKELKIPGLREANSFRRKFRIPHVIRVVLVSMMRDVG